MKKFLDSYNESDCTFTASKMAKVTPALSLSIGTEDKSAVYGIYLDKVSPTVLGNRCILRA